MNTNLKDQLSVIDGNIKKIDELRRATHKPMCEAIHDMCVSLGGEIDLHDYNDAYGSMSVSYDGGNHPEYASDAFADIVKVRPIKLKDWFDNGKEYKSFEVTLDCHGDEIGEYEENRMSQDEVESVYRQVCGFFSENSNED